MVRIKVAYDANSRTFKLLDQEFDSILENGVSYEIRIPLILNGLVEAEDLDLIASAVGHA